MYTSVKAFIRKFQKDLFYDLKDSQELIVGYTLTQLHDHIKDNFLKAWAIARKVT